MLAGGYRENTISSLDAPFPEGHSASTDQYEYFSDSDLDEEDIDVKISEEVGGEASAPVSEVNNSLCLRRL